MTVELTPLLPAQAELLEALHRAGFEKPWPAEAFSSLLADPLRFGALAHMDDEAAGFVLLQQALDEAEVLTFVVEPAKRRKGIGCALLERAICECAARRCRRLILEVAETNISARTLYEKVGFVEIGQRSAYYAHQKGLETALVLARSVVPAVSSR